MLLFLAAFRPESATKQVFCQVVLATKVAKNGVSCLTLRCNISVVINRFIADPEVHNRYKEKIQEQGIFGIWNEVNILRPLKILLGAC